MAKLTLQGPPGAVLVRAGRTAIDAPVSGAWTPDNLNADESSLGPDDVVLDALDWEDVRLVVNFSGTLDASETVDVLPLRALPTGGAAPGRVWVPLDSVTLAPQLGSELVLTDGGLLAFRITALDLGTGTKVDLVVTGGARIRRR